MKMKNFFDNLDDKFKAFPTWKKGLVILLFIIIMSSIGYQIYDLQDRYEITTVTFPGDSLFEGCEDVYVKGILNSTTCPEYMERVNPYDPSTHHLYEEQYELQDYNFSNISYVVE